MCASIGDLNAQEQKRRGWGDSDLPQVMLPENAGPMMGTSESEEKDFLI